ncbi:hypothetical protein [Streptomyces griseus]|uniref:hypothetical protein n=1 Tax=Streptomyces griseus TaxID=1911 RepID=UPI000B0E9044|nr:hypothetical protein [Streptomyces griseus]
MRRLGHRAPREEGDGELAATVEGYLLAHSHQEQARREAESLCARMPWLTTAQAEDVSRHYVRQRIVLTRQMLRSTVERADQLRQEYEERYAALRRDLLKRHAACASAVLACAVAVSTAASLFSR